MRLIYTTSPVNRDGSKPTSFTCTWHGSTLLHAEFLRDKIDYRYRLANGWFDRIDGEPKTWGLQKCASTRWQDPTDPVRANLELSIGLRNKVEHRYHEAIAQFTTGYAQALLLNYEQELTLAFGDSESLGEQLRFPIFVGSITGVGQARLDKLRGDLPKDTRDFIARFEAGLSDQTTSDQRYEFRINLVPKLGPKAQADSSMTFVRESDLTDEERAALAGLDKSGKVVIREQLRPIASAGLMRPSDAAIALQAKVQFKVGTHHIVRAWKKLECRPAYGAEHPERTLEKYCVYDEPHGDYLYTEAFVEKVAREMKTSAKFESFTGIIAELL